MAALSEYPTTGKIVRGDPLTIPVNITVNGVPQDVSTWNWRAQIRTAFDGTLIDEFTMTTTVPAGGTVESTVLMNLTGDQTAKLSTGMVFDLEQLDDLGETVRTWWIVTKLNVQLDVSTDVPLTLVEAPRVDVMKARG